MHETRGPTKFASAGKKQKEALVGGKEGWKSVYQYSPVVGTVRRAAQALPGLRGSADSLSRAYPQDPTPVMKPLYESFQGTLM